MIDLRLQGCGALRLGFERLLESIEERSQPRETPLNRSVEPSASPLGGTLASSVL